MLVQILSIKLIDVLPVHLGGGRQAERQSLSQRGRTAERALDLMGKEEDRGSPSSFPPSDPSAFPTSTGTAPPPPRRGTRVKAPSSKRAFRERSVCSGSHSQCGQSPPPPPSRADSAYFPPNQTTHTLCVSPLI